MKKKVSQLLDNPGKIVSILILIGMVCTGIYFAMNLPKRVEAVEQDVTDLKKIIDYYYRQDQKQQPQFNQPPYPPPPPRQPPWPDGGVDTEGYWYKGVYYYYSEGNQP